MTIETNNSQFKQGYLYVLRLLSISNRSNRDIRERLLEKGYSGEVAETIIRRLNETGLLNEKKNIHEISQWAISGKHLGRKRIRMELKQKGFQESAIDDELENYSPELEKAQALEIARNRVERLKNIDSQKRKKQIYDFLVRRGFDFEIARETAIVVNKEKEAEKRVNENV